LLAIVWRRHRGLIESYGHYGLLITVAMLTLVAKLSRQGGYLITDNTRWGNAMIYELTLMISLGLILWALSGRYVSVLTWTPVRYLGRISYSVYLVHMLMLMLMLPTVHNRRVLAVVAGAATLAFAALSWHLLEKPILGMEPREASVLITAEADPERSLVGS
jgi:peptidoglycan/LPS O-acetylase OafA/YrhL